MWDPHGHVATHDCIFGQSLEFFYISDDETDFTVGIVSRNLATTLNSEIIRIYTFFKATSVVGDT